MKLFDFVHLQMVAIAGNDTVEVVNVLMNNKVDQEENFPASQMISSQILGYDGGEVDSKEKVEIMFPLNVRKGLN